MKKNIFYIVLFSFLFFSCTDKSTKGDLEIQDEYFQRFFDALSSNDENVISSTIEYIDNIIIENDKTVLSAYYDKARLLYKLRKYNEALETLDKNSNSLFNRYLKATLLTQTGNNEKARGMLLELKTEYLIELNKNKYAVSKREGLVQAIMGLVLLLNQDYDFEVNEFVKKGIFTEQEGSGLIKNRFTKELILQSCWPE
jgi:tetratricopeptide (TPR) repeat protein